MKQKTRRIAGPVLALAIGIGPAIWAETPGLRISAPSLGWVLSPDGTRLVEVAGLAASPRAGRDMALAAAASRSWASPDASSVLVQAETGLFLIRDAAEPQLILEVSGASLSAAWDRAAAGFAVCGADFCQAFDAAGASAGRWQFEAAPRLLAYSSGNGLIVATGDDAAVWLRGADKMTLDSVPVAAAFRPGTGEVWLLDAAGHLAGRDFSGRPAGEAQLFENALGLIASRDGSAFFAASETAAAVFSPETGQSTPIEIGEPAEGVWAGPGAFTARLHDTAKRPIAIWNGETGEVGWMPAGTASVEVAQ